MPQTDRGMILGDGRSRTTAQEASLSTALVVYRSHTGVTRRYAEEIAAYLGTLGVQASVASVGECDMNSISGADYLFLGCWTSGMFVIRQHPDGPWLSFVRDMPKLAGAAPDGTARPKVALFTTYRLRTGSQFPKMRAALKGKTAEPVLELKSRSGSLSDGDRRTLGEFVSR